MKCRLWPGLGFILQARAFVGLAWFAGLGSGLDGGLAQKLGPCRGLLVYILKALARPGQVLFSASLAFRQNPRRRLSLTESESYFPHHKKLRLEPVFKIDFL
jgi:hypothetical protein